MPGVLEGVRVIDFGQYIAGPMAAMLLGDQGADVVRVDPPGGPRWNTPANATWNRNKRSIALDLKQDGDRETARQLIAGADVVIENFRPGVMERLGLGAAAMTAANPRLIYCSLPGFGSDDPRAQVKAWEGVVGAATGAYRATHATNGRPVYTVVPYGSMYAAFLCAVTVAMALNARARSGVGQRVEIPLFDATFSVVGARGLLVNGKPVPEPEFNWSRQLPCKDGRWLMYVANNKRFEAFIKSIGMDKWRDAKLPPKELAQKYDETMRARTSKEWEDIIAEIGSEGVICHTSAEWLKHPQALESGIIADYDDPELGRFRGPGINTRLSATPGSVRAPRPKTDAHRAEILRELATRKPATAAAGSEVLRAALEGVKVVDLCIVLAGPTCGRTLAEFGADVIRIDSPHVKTVLRHNDINRGKRSILVDLKTPGGLEIFWKLVDKADVVLQNFRGGVAERLGIDYERVRARRPDIVYGSMNTFGHIGPYANRPGHEQLGQAVSGMQVRFGSAKPATAPFAANDYGTGLMACYGVALALLHRRRTGEGQFVDSALAYTATMLQSALLQDYTGKAWDEPHGQEATGSGPLDRLYQASDGWLYLSAPAPGELAHCTELAGLANLHGTELERALEERMRSRTVAAWVELLNKAGIGAHRVVPDLPELMTDPLTVARGVAITRDHEGFGPITTTAPGVRLSRTPVTPGRPAAKPGSDAASVLAEIGMAGDLDRLIREKVVAVDGVKAGC
ncbi:MAG TPA: CoA transferase [Burkholderiales bacterium]|jgi:crotonobetainyl-CoA:carnitine CoA-transferase CaiB-like acyl-CoA transferase|nr:CoA transferase [Burkholderiales bacterium]